MFIINIIRVIVFIISLRFTCLIIFNQVKRRLHKEYNTVDSLLSDFSLNPILFTLVLGVMIIISALTNNTFLQLLGNESIKIKPEGTYVYNIQIEDNFNNITVMPAIISKTYARDYDGNVEGANYYLDDFLLSNGSLYYVGGEEIYLDQFSHIYVGENFDEYYVQLLDQKATIPEVNETSSISISDLLFMGVEEISYLITATCFIYYIGKHSHQKA